MRSFIKKAIINVRNLMLDESNFVFLWRIAYAN